MNRTVSSGERATAYCRVSTNKTEQELSLENQIAFFSEYVGKRGDTLVEIYAEKGKSATKMMNRPELQRLIKDAKAGKFKRVYIKDISRAFRNTFDFISVSRELSQHGVVFHILGMGDSGKDVDEFILNLMAMVAEQESRKMSERVKFGKAIGREEGVVPNFVFGYDKIDRTTLKINPKEAFWVKRIFDLYTEHGWGQCRIAEELFKNKVQTKKLKDGEPNFVWSTTTVGHILRHEIYTGKLVSGKQSMKNLYNNERVEIPEEKWVVHDRPELRIISDEQFEKAKKIAEESGRQLKSNMNKGRSSNKHLFSNIIKCGSCGFSFRRWTRKPGPNNRYVNEYAWWTCSRRAAYGKDSCQADHVRIDEDWLLSGLTNLFSHIISRREEFFSSIEKKCNEYVKLYIAEQSGVDVDKLKQQAEELNKQRTRIKDMVKRGLIEMDEAEQDMIPINEELKRIRVALSAADKTEELTKRVKASVKEFIKNFTAEDFTKNLDNIRLKKIVREIRVVSKEEIYVYFNMGENGIDIPFSLTDTFVDDTDYHHGTQGPERAAARLQPHPLPPGEGGAGGEQGRAAHPGGHCHPAEI